MDKGHQAFVAYSAQDKFIADEVLEAVRRANAKSSAIRYEPWEFNDISGQPLISPILERIHESLFIVADITYLNLNVVFEIGFAIGSGKRVFLIKHRTIEGDKSIADQVGIFDTLGYHLYSTHDDLCHRLVSHIDHTPLNLGNASDLKSPIYIIEPPIKNEAATIIISRIKKARYRFRSFNPTEESRLSAADAIRQVSASAGVVVSLYSTKDPWAAVHNIRSLFVSGVAAGLGKPLLMLSPHDFDAPLDVRDEVSVYQRAEDIVQHIADFVPNIAERLQQFDPSPLKPSTTLQSLRMGDPTAENEMTTLGDYYLPTDEYGRTLRGDVNLVVGRKGAGKTALFIQARDEVRADKRNVVVDLKPEGYQLIKLKEDILSTLLEGSRQHLITAFWEYLVLLEVAYKLLEKDRSVYKYNHDLHDLYLKLDAAYRGEGTLTGGDFSERLLTLSTRISEEYKSQYRNAAAQRLSNDQVAQLLYRHDILELKERIATYLQKKRSVWVLFDNLDKGWSTNGIDVIDAVAMRCLIDAGRKIERDMRKAQIAFHCIVFIRNDVYEHLMEHSSDYGKEMRAVLDWTDPDLLREMIRRRLVFGLGIDPHVPFEKVWQRVCISHFKGTETSTFMIECSLMRPRNFLKLFSYSQGFANNFSHAIITEEDIDKAFRAYSQDLLIELGHELRDVFPDAKDLLYYFLDAKNVMSPDEIRTLLIKGRVDEPDCDAVIEFLFYYGVIGLRVDDNDKYIFNVNYDPKVLQIRAELAGENAEYVINPAFCPALGIA